jgi:hypothetical protein
MAKRMKLALDERAVKQGVAVAAVVGAGAVAAQAGGAIAKRSGAVGDFAARGAWNEAAVDAGAGLVLDAVLLLALAKAKGPGAAKRVAPFLVGGTMLSAIAPAVAPTVTSAIDRAIGALMGSGAAALPAAAPGGRVLPLRAAAPGGIEYGAGAIDLVPGGTYGMAAGAGFAGDLY